MKIKKFNKRKNNKYTLEIEDMEDLTLYDDVVVKYELIRYKEIDEALYDELLKYNAKLESYYKAIKYLTRKLRTEKEIVKYLEKDYERDAINFTIDKLKKDGYLNNDLYIKSYINDQVNFGSMGPNKIRKELTALGLDLDSVNEYLNNIKESVWLDKLRRLVEKKIRINHQYSNSKLKEKILYDFSNDGYYKWMVEEIIDSSEFNDTSNILEKEYNKLFNKLSRKYEGSNLDYQIKMKLRVKGFSGSDIDNLLDKKKNF